MKVDSQSTKKVLNLYLKYLQQLKLLLTFTRQQVNRYISEVVVGWRRRKALEAAEAAVSSDGVVMQ